MTVDNTCTSHCAKQSHVLRHFDYCFFLAKCVDDEEPFAKVALTKANWVANRYCVAVTCHTKACICISSATGTTVGKFAPPDSSPCASILICMDTELLCFVHTLANSSTPHTVGKPIVNLLTPLSQILNKDHNLWMKSCTCFPYIKWPVMCHQIWRHKRQILHPLRASRLFCSEWLCCINTDYG